MPTTGVALIPPVNPAISVASKLITCLSQHHPDLEQVPFHLEHRLFNDTSSQLPGGPHPRAYTHLFSSSHDLEQAFLCSSSPVEAGKTAEVALITIPVSQMDGVTSMILQKHQPLWYPRSMLHIEGGVSVIMNLKGRAIGLSIGDAKASARSAGTGTLRGTVVEIFRENDAVDSAEADAAADKAEMRALLDFIFKETDQRFDDVQIITDKTLSREDSEEQAASAQTDWNLAKLYMTLFTPSTTKR